MAGAPPTVRSVLEWTTAHFRRRGIESARLDAELLLAHALGGTRLDLYVDPDRALSADERDRYRALVEARARRVPTAHLVGRREFFSLAFEVTPDVLVPRPETEHLVEEALRLAERIADPAVADVGTGSGCVAIALLTTLGRGRAWATDRSSAALAVAQRNAERHGVADRLVLLEGDLLAPLAVAGLEGRLDLVVSNPPYLALPERDALPPEVRDHEPADALFAGPDGLEAIRAIAAHAPAFLRPGGSLLLEIPPHRRDDVASALAAVGAYGPPRFASDLARLPRVAIAPRTCPLTPGRAPRRRVRRP